MDPDLPTKLPWRCRKLWKPSGLAQQGLRGRGAAAQVVIHNNRTSQRPLERLDIIRSSAPSINERPNLSTYRVIASGN
jgi:hypothetical protein